MDIKSAKARTAGSHIIAIEVSGVSLADFAALRDGTGHLEVVLYSDDGKEKMAVAAKNRQLDGTPPFSRFDVSKT